MIHYMYAFKNNPLCRGCGEATVEMLVLNDPLGNVLDHDDPMQFPAGPHTPAELGLFDEPQYCFACGEFLPVHLSQTGLDMIAELMDSGRIGAECRDHYMEAIIFGY